MLRDKRHSHSQDKKRVVDPNGIYPFMVRHLEWAKIAEGVSKDTLKRRESALRRFIAWCDERSLSHPKDITLPILERYQRYLFYYRKADGEPLSFSSQQVMLSSLKQFFKWLTQQNYLLYNPASELQLPKAPKTIPRTILTPDSIRDLLNQPDTSQAAGMRDRTLLELFYSCGLRRTELADLTVFDVDLKRQILLIRAGKGNKDRILPIGEQALHWLIHYLDTVHDVLRGPLDQDRLFITDYGEPFTGGSLGRLVKKYLKQAGIDVTGSCHLLRHAMATHMLDNGADIRFIQAMLGHDDLNSTEIYTRVSVEKLREIHKATHPSGQRPRVAGREPEP